MNRQERELQKNCLKDLAFSECLTLFPVDIKPVPGGHLAPGIAGYPDLLVVGYKEDRQFHIELKIGKNDLNKRQVRWHERYEFAGGSVFVCRTMLEVAEVMVAKVREYGWKDQRLEAIYKGLLD